MDRDGQFVVGGLQDGGRRRSSLEIIPVEIESVKRSAASWRICRLLSR